MILLHKANRKDNGEEVQGILSKVWGQYLITSEDNEDDVFYVTEESIRPVLDMNYAYTSLPNFGENIESLFYNNAASIAELAGAEVKGLESTCTVQMFVQWLKEHGNWEKVGLSGYSLK